MARRMVQDVSVVSPSVNLYPSVATMSLFAFGQRPGSVASSSQSSALMTTLAHRTPLQQRRPAHVIAYARG